jgi:hypothetical protein
MTQDEAKRAMEAHLKVEGGEGDDYDTGYIHEIVDRDTAIVGWDSGARTPCLLADLSLA